MYYLLKHHVLKHVLFIKTCIKVHYHQESLVFLTEFFETCHMQIQLLNCDKNAVSFLMCPKTIPDQARCIPAPERMFHPISVCT